MGLGEPSPHSDWYAWVHDWDNLEWADDYVMQFGLFNFDRITKERTPTRSVSTYREISTKNTLPV